jgi:hypothetical protein
MRAFGGGASQCQSSWYAMFLAANLDTDQISNSFYPWSRAAVLSVTRFRCAAGAFSAEVAAVRRSEVE